MFCPPEWEITYSLLNRIDRKKHDIRLYEEIFSFNSVGRLRKCQRSQTFQWRFAGVPLKPNLNAGLAAL